MSLKIEILTFNQAGEIFCKEKNIINSSCHDEIKKGKSEDPDIVVIGLQESNNSFFGDDNLINGLLNDYNEERNSDKYVLLRAHRATFGKNLFVANRLGLLIKENLLSSTNNNNKITKNNIKSKCTKEEFPKKNDQTPTIYENAQFICEQQEIKIKTKTFIMLFLKIKKDDKNFELCFITTHLPFKNDKLGTFQGFEERVNQLIKIRKNFYEFKEKLNMKDPVLFIMGDLNFRCNFDSKYFDIFFDNLKRTLKPLNLSNNDIFRNFVKYNFLKGEFLLEGTYYQKLREKIEKILDSKNNKTKSNKLKKLKEFDELTTFLNISKKLSKEIKLNKNKNNNLIIKNLEKYNSNNEHRKLRYILFKFFQFLKTKNVDPDLKFFSELQEGIDNEGPNFEPTCKYKKEKLIYEGSESEKLPRYPSWCDRILYMKNNKYNIICKKYESEGGHKKSDHKWVMGEFNIII